MLWEAPGCVLTAASGHWLGPLYPFYRFEGPCPEEVGLGLELQNLAGSSGAPAFLLSLPADGGLSKVKVRGHAKCGASTEQ